MPFLVLRFYGLIWGQWYIKEALSDLNDAKISFLSIIMFLIVDQQKRFLIRRIEIFGILTKFDGISNFENIISIGIESKNFPKNLH